MRLISFVIVLLGMAVAQAQVPAVWKTVRVSQTLGGLDLTGRVYYNCDSVEMQARQFLQTLGAQNVKANCVGGIDSFGRVSPAYLTVVFDRLVPVDSTQTKVSADYKSVRIASRTDCSLYSEFSKSYLKHFSVKNASITARCDSYRLQRFVFDGLVLKSN